MSKNYRKADPAGDQARERIVEAFGSTGHLVEEVAAIFLAGLSLFMVLSLLSYGGMSPEGLPHLEGWTGKAGGYLAFAMFQLLGYGAHGAPVLFGLCALFLFFEKRNLLKPWRFALALLTLILVTALLHVLFQDRRVLGGHMAGGAMGAWAGGLLLPVFAKAGTLLVLATAILILLVLVSCVTIRQALGFMARSARLGFGFLAGGMKKMLDLVLRRGEAARERALMTDGESVEPDLDIGEEERAGDEEDILEAVMMEGGPPARRREGRPLRKKLPPGKTSAFKLPPYDLLREPAGGDSHLTKEQMKSVDQKLVETLASYGIMGEVTAIHPGPVVTTYELRPEKGTKISSITSREDDITMSLEAQKVRIVAPIPGKNAVGFEIPNPSRSTVYLRELLQDGEFDRMRKKIPLAVGKDIIGRPYIADLDKMPHLLIAGTTGSGKSVCINAMLMSLLYTFNPDELKMILVDPKQVEMQTYGGIPHLLLPVVTDPKKAAVALKWAVDEMERRYQLFAVSGSKDMPSYNRKLGRAGERKCGDEPRQEARPPEAASGAAAAGGGGDVPAAPPSSSALPEPEGPLPYIIIVIDELADLMMAAVRDVEWAVIRLAQKARAAGIHLIVATQRPSVNVVTGLIKANFPCRIAFRVAAKIDSRVMLDTNGAETLLGDGDMLILPPGGSDLVRIQGAFVSEEEIRNVTAFLREQRQAAYREEILSGQLEDDGLPAEDGEGDEYYEKAVTLVLGERKASVSYLQRRFSIGYNRAARIMERMEREGIVGPQVPGKPYREVICPNAP